MAKFTVVIEGELPDNWSGNMLLDNLAKALHERYPELHIAIKDVKTEGPGLLKAQSLEWDNSRQAWQ